MSYLNYKDIFNQALNQIKVIRDPHANDTAEEELQWDKVIEHSFFSFDKDFNKYNILINKTIYITIGCLKSIILELDKKYNNNFETINLENYERKDILLRDVIFTILDKKNKILLFFKNTEECNLWKLPKESDEVSNVISKYNAVNCKYIYFMDDYAYLQLIGHNNDINDPGKGNNFYDFKYLFDFYFKEENYDEFNDELHIYLNNVKDYIGYSCVKNLNSHALVNFKYITMEKFYSYNKYEELINAVIVPDKGINKNKECILFDDDFKVINNNFKSEVTNKIYLSKIDFIESIITSEWLLESLTDCKAIDLTSIGSGYFKAGEQLMYSIICLHKNEGRLIKKMLSKNDLVPLTKYNIEKKDYLDFSLGSMSNFFKNNKDIFNSDVSNSVDYICEYLFEYSKLRNGYFHKENIRKPEVISNIKDKTYKLFFLLLGSINLREKDYVALDLPSMDYYNDYYKLCEFVNYHSNTYYFLKQNGVEQTVISYADMNTRIVDNHIEYSGIYFIDNNTKNIIRFDKNNVPDEIYYGKLHIENSESVSFKPIKIFKIFENGKFIGPNIVKDKNYSF